MGRVCTRMGEKIVCRILVGKPEGKSFQEDLAVSGTIILKWIL
jgi:hypothetical protein